MNGFKDGASSDDPFDGGEGEDGSGEAVINEEDESATQDSSEDSEVPPYAMRRNSVKEDRDMVPFWLQEVNEDRLEVVKDDVEERLGYDVYLTDFKEAVVLEGLENPERIAERLNEWGCEYA